MSSPTIVLDSEVTVTEVPSHSHISTIEVFRVSSNGHLLATADREGSIRIWNLEKLSCVRHFTVPERLIPRDIALTEDGCHALAVTEEGGDLIWWDFRIGTNTKLEASLPKGSRYDFVYFAPEPSRTIIATTQGADASAMVWRRQDNDTGLPQWVGRAGPAPAAPWAGAFFSASNALFLLRGLLPAGYNTSIKNSIEATDAIALPKYRGEDLDAVVLLMDGPEPATLGTLILEENVHDCVLTSTAGAAGASYIVCADKTYLTFAEVGNAALPGITAHVGVPTRVLMAEKQGRDRSGDCTLCIAPNGHLVVTFINALEVWSVEKRCPLQLILHPMPNYIYLALRTQSPDGPLSFLLSSTVEVFDMPKHTQVERQPILERRGTLRLLTGHEDCVNAIASVATDTGVEVIVTVSDDGMLKTWRTMPSGRLRYLGTVDLQDTELNYLCIIPDAAGITRTGIATACVVSEKGTLALIDVQGDSPPALMAGRRWRLASETSLLLAFALDACVVGVTKDGTVHGFDLNAPGGNMAEVSHALKLGDGAEYLCGAAASDNRRFIVCWDANIVLASAERVAGGSGIGLAKLQQRGHTCDINAAVFCDSINMIAIADENRDVVLYNTANGKLSRALRLTGQAKPANDMVVSSDGDLLAVVSSSEIRIWHLGSMTCVAAMVTNEARPTCAAFASRDTLLLAGDARGQQPLIYNIQADPDPVSLTRLLGHVVREGALFGNTGLDAICIMNDELVHVEDFMRSAVARPVFAPPEASDSTPCALAVVFNLQSALVAYEDGTLILLQNRGHHTRMQPRQAPTSEDDWRSLGSEAEDSPPVTRSILGTLPFAPERLWLTPSDKEGGLIAIATQMSGAGQDDHGDEKGKGQKRAQRGEPSARQVWSPRTSLWTVSLKTSGVVDKAVMKSELPSSLRLLAVAPDGSVCVVAAADSETMGAIITGRLELRSLPSMILLASFDFGQAVTVSTKASVTVGSLRGTGAPKEILVAAMSKSRVAFWALEGLCNPVVAPPAALLPLQPSWAANNKDFFPFADVSFFFPSDVDASPLVAVVHNKGQVRLFSVTTGIVCLVFESELERPSIKSPAAAPGLMLMQELDSDNEIAVWRLDLVAGKARVAAFLGQAATAIDTVAISMDNRYLYATCGHHVQAWDLDTRQCAAVLTPCVFGHMSNFSHLAEMFGAGSVEPGREIQHVAAAAVTADNPLPMCNALLLLNSDQQLLVGTSSGHFLVLSTPSLKILRFLVGHHGASIDAMAISGDGTVFATASSTIRVWDTVTLAAKKEFLSIISSEPPSCLALDASGSALFEGTHRGYVAYWDLAHKPRMLFRSHAHPRRGGVASVLIIEHGDVGISCGSDKTVRVWQLRSGSCSKVFSGLEGTVASLAVSLDERYILAGRENSYVQVWDLQSRRAICLMQVGDNNKEQICSLAMANTGSTLAVGTGEGSIWLLPTAGLLLGHGLPRVPAKALLTTAKLDRYLPQRRHRLHTLKTLLHRAPYTLTLPLLVGDDDESESDTESLLGDDNDAAPNACVKHPPPMSAEDSFQKPLGADNALETVFLPNQVQSVRSSPREDDSNSEDESSDESDDGALTSLSWAVRGADRLDVLEVFLAHGPPYLSLTNHGGDGKTSLLRQALEGGNVLVVSAVAKAIVQAARASDVAFTSSIRTPGGAAVLELSSLTEAFTTDVVTMLVRFPEVAAVFLRDLGLVRALTDQGFVGYRASIGVEDTIIVAGGMPSQETQLWLGHRRSGWLQAQENKEGQSIPVEARIVPLPSAASFVNDGSGRRTSFLQALIQAKSADVFDNFIAKTVIDYKWDKFGKSKFAWHCVIFLVQLVLMSSLVWLLPEPVPSAESRTGVGAGYWFSSAIIVGCLALGAAHKLIYECRQAWQTSSHAAILLQDVNAKSRSNEQRKRATKWSTWRLRRSRRLEGLKPSDMATELTSLRSAESSASSVASSDYSSLKNAALPLSALKRQPATVLTLRRIASILADHFSELWNVVDALQVILSLALCAAFFLGWRHTKAILAVAVYSRWLGLLYYLQPLKATGPLVRMIVAICYDVRYFIMVLGIALVATFLVLHMLVTGDGYGQPGTALFATYNMLFLGDFDVGLLDGEYTVLARVLFVLTMLFVAIILLNLLIAIMGDSYTRIQEKSEVEFLRLRATVLLEYELFMSPEELADQTKFPKWLHVLVPHGRGVGSSRDAEAWHGLLGTMEERLRDLEESLNLRSDRLREDALASVAASGHRIGEVNDRLSTLEREVARLGDHADSLTSVPPTPRRVFVGEPRVPTSLRQEAGDDDFGF